MASCNFLILRKRCNWRSHVHAVVRHFCTAFYPVSLIIHYLRDCIQLREELGLPSVFRSLHLNSATLILLPTWSDVSLSTYGLPYGTPR